MAPRRPLNGHYVMPHSETPGWDYIGDSYYPDPFLIDGVDVFEHDWRLVGSEDRVATVYGGQRHHLDVWRIEIDGKSIVFASGELAPLAYGFCRRT